MGGGSQPALKCSELEFGALWNTLGWWAQAASHIPALPMPGGERIQLPHTTVPLGRDSIFPHQLSECSMPPWYLEAG